MKRARCPLGAFASDFREEKMMSRFRLLAASATAALALTLGGSLFAGGVPALAAGPHLQSQMVPAGMNPGMGMGMRGMGMGMTMGAGLPVYSPSVSGFLGMQPYPMLSSAYSSGPSYLPMTSSGPTYSQVATAGLSAAELQEVCHQYSVGLQYGTIADDPNFDQLCGVTGASTSYAAPASTSPSQPTGYSYP
jgi:hypothetical protein